MKKLFFVISSLLLVLGMLGPVQPAQANPLLRDARAGIEKVDPALQDALGKLPSGAMETVIVTLQQQANVNPPGLQNRPDRQQAVIDILQSHAQASQRAILAVLKLGQGQGRVAQVVPFWVFNGLSVTATPDMILELAARDDVSSITPDAVDIVPVGNAALAAHAALAAPEANLAKVNAPALWSMGYYGQGIVVASLDSGVSVNHPDLVSRWRGGSNSWFDPYGQHLTTPTDMTGHGTWTMGVMVGGDADGTTIGMAPQAQWIAAKIFNDSGSATATAIHQAFQWVLDPDGNPATADAPDVVNNSWAYGSPGCNLGFQPDLQALRAAGILPVFAAGNYGPGAGSSVSPANNPEAFAVGATDNTDVIDSSSSRGPSACGEAQTTYPELVAPGVNIYTSDLGGLYYSVSGTSLSAPHVAGGLALLLSAFPGLSADNQAAALANTARDLGSAGVDNTYGNGRLDVLAAYQWLDAGNQNSSTPTPTSTAVPSATATSTPMPTSTATATSTATVVPPTATPTPTPTFTPAPSVNIALNKVVTVSSFLDSASTGSMAVDGNSNTLWKTKQTSGRNKSSSEWILIDLGSDFTVNQIVLEWDAYYATKYSLQVSSNKISWNTVFNTTSGDGTVDTVMINPTSTRYVKLVTTGWNNSSLRNWLREISVFTSGGVSQPTPTSTAVSSATPTLPAGGTSMHIGDLDGLKTTVNRKYWSAKVTILVHDSSENTLAGATVTGLWSYGATGTCVTDNQGICQISSSNISTKLASTAFTVTNIENSSITYNSAANHDPDVDSSGTMITVYKP